MKISKEGAVLGLAIAIGTLSYFLYFRPRQEQTKRVEEKRLEKENRANDYIVMDAQKIEPKILEDLKKDAFKLRMEGFNVRTSGPQEWYFEDLTEDIKDYSKVRLFIFNCDYTDPGQEIRYNGDCKFSDYSGGKVYLIEISWAGGKEPFITKSSLQLGANQEIERLINYGAPIVLKRIEQLRTEQQY
jgi:hypothetical protein